MNSLVAVALWAWIPLGILCFTTMHPVRAILFLYVAGWLFLPVALIDAPFVDLSKDVSIAVACLVGALCFAPRPAGVRALRAVDLPMLAWCFAPFCSSLSNGLGAYDGCSGTFARFLTWGVPYFLGRYYLSSEHGALALCKAIFIGGLVYVPLCWIEIRFSPQMHAWVYGFHQHSFAQTMRGGSYRPQVFLHHGLMLGMWMCAASLAGLALWRGRLMARAFGMPIGLCAMLVAGTTVLCHSLGALVLLIVGVTAYAASRRMRHFPLQLLALLPLAYVALRAPGWWSGEQTVDWVRSIDEDRALSLQFRFDAESRLLARAMEQPMFGWGGFSRAFVTVSDEDTSLVISDSQWIIAFGQNGAFGLCALFLAGAAPMWTWLRNDRARRGARGSAHAIGLALALVLGLYMVDNLVNAMTNPVFMLAAGALAGWKPALASARARTRVPGRREAQPRTRAPSMPRLALQDGA